MNENYLADKRFFEVEESSKLAPLPPNYDPIVIEVFDELGLLLSFINKEELHQTRRPFNHKATYIAWYFDEQLVFFQMGSKVLVDRLKLLATNFINLIEENLN